MNEEWKWIKGYEGIYQISNFGRLKSFRGSEQGRILSTINKNGWYLTVNLYDDDQKRLTTRIHRLVAEAFIGKIPEGYHIHHIDGNKQNNVVSNLKIIHPKEHREETEKERPQVMLGIINYNKYQRPKRILQFTKNGKFIAEYVNAKEASRHTGVCQRNILQVAAQTPFNTNGNIRKQAGGFVWKFTQERGGMPSEY